MKQSVMTICGDHRCIKGHMLFISKQNKVRHSESPDCNANNAVDDIIMVDNISTAANFSDLDIVKHSYSSDSHFYLEMFNSDKWYLHVLIGKGIVKTSEAENIAESGLALSHLKLIYDRDRQDGLTCVFSSKTSE